MKNNVLSSALFVFACLPAFGNNPLNTLGRQQEYGYPQAEYCKAGSILMYTPGTELFDGVIHPDAIDELLEHDCFDAKDSRDINYLTMDMYVRPVGGKSYRLDSTNSGKGFREFLQCRGVKVEWVPLDNLIGGYGAAHCMTQVLKRNNFVQLKSENHAGY